MVIKIQYYYKQLKLKTFKTLNVYVACNKEDAVQILNLITKKRCKDINKIICEF